MKIKEIFSTYPFEYDPERLPDLDATMISGDSRRIIPGGLFVACKGDTSDGHDYIEQSIKNGASIVVGEKRLENLSVPYLQVNNSRQSLAYLAAGFYKNPARKMCMIGVTGTDGKTTTTNLIYEIIKYCGMKAGMISTVNAVISADVMIDTGYHVTTPDSPEIQKYLYQMHTAGLTHVVLETTSHGLSQYRVDACEFDIGVITNITHEHLDYHGSFEKYRDAKGRLFLSLGEKPTKDISVKRVAVLNKDDDSYRHLSHLSSVPSVSYSLIDNNSDFFAYEINNSNGETKFNIKFPENQVIKIHTPLMGRFNVYNCLAAFSTAVAGLNINPEFVAAGIASVRGVPGRMEKINLGQDFYAIIDFAHTPNALIEALKTARQMTSGKVIVVFGSAGRRDIEKRGMMARYAIELADISIFTAEDPRTESLNEILTTMEESAKRANGKLGDNYYTIPDRGEAIRKGIKLANKGDLVICCGKGHEQSMCFGEIEYIWDDRVAMRAAISEHLGIDGPSMPFLPTHKNNYEQ